MRWKKKKPEDGDRRIQKAFAIIPEELSNGITVWLENFYSDQVYKVTRDTIFDRIIFELWRTERTYVQDKVE